ncbi:bifunctional oligoribonuclease/PAP phosphatase NrnA [Candidatus Zixiibacteriota bacterium]
MIDGFSEFRTALKGIERVLITTHVNPDGDAVGSVLGMRSILEQLGKLVEIVVSDPIPPKYQFLLDRPVRILGDPELNEMVKQEKFGMVIYLDASEQQRVGAVLDWCDEWIDESVVIVNIDHHISNDSFGDIVVLDPERSSAAELVLEAASVLGVVLTSQAADQLFAGVLTDTGSFQYSNTNVLSLTAASEMVKAGASPATVADRIYHQRSIFFYRLLGYLLGTMELYHQGRTCVMMLPLEIAKSLWPEGEMDTEGIVDYTVRLKGTEVGIFLRETTGDTLRASLRSRGNVNVQQVTESLGGGGHASAAGCTLEGSMNSARDTLLAELGKHLG